MADDKAQEKRPYDETVESAKLFEDIEESRTKQASKLEGDVRAAEPGEAGKKKAAEPSIGELFSNLVKMSPRAKIRIERDSIGSLFKKYISKRG